MKKSKWLAGCVVGLAGYMVSLFVPLVSPFTRYPLYVIKCGGRPIAARTFAAGYSYRVPSDKKHYKIDSLTDRYFCTEAEAEAAGFHKYPSD